MIVALSDHMHISEIYFRFLGLIIRCYKSITELELKLIYSFVWLNHHELSLWLHQLAVLSTAETVRLLYAVLNEAQVP